MTRIQRYAAYAKWDWMMNRRFYLTYGIAIALGILVLFLISFIDNILCNNPSYANSHDVGVITVFSLIILIFPMAFSLQAYHTKQDRMLALGLPVEKGSKLLHHILAIYAITIASVIAGFAMFDIVFQASPIFFNVNTYGESVCVNFINEIKDSFSIAPNVEEWLRPRLIYTRVYFVFAVFLISAAILLVTSCKFNNFYISFIIVCLYFLIYFSIINHFDITVQTYRRQGEDQYAIHLMQLAVIVEFIIFIVLCIWGVKSFKKMQIVSRFIH